MALALTQPEAVSKMIGASRVPARGASTDRHCAVVDIAPGVGAISPEFSAYCDAMMAIDEAKVTSRKEADAILAKTEPVRRLPLLATVNCCTDRKLCRRCQSDSSC